MCRGEGVVVLACLYSVRWLSAGWQGAARGLCRVNEVVVAVYTIRLSINYWEGNLFKEII